MDSETRTYRTGDREQVLDLTADVADFVSGRGDGLLHLFVPHATAGLAILETGAGSDDDLLAALRDLLPADDRWLHRHGSPGHGRSHVMPALIPPYASVPVLGGRLVLEPDTATVIAGLHRLSEEQLLLMGREFLDGRYFSLAERILRLALNRNPFHIPIRLALTKCRSRRMATRAWRRP